MAQRLADRLAWEFREKIARGEWSAGLRIPTSRQLAAAYKVSVNTVQHAFRKLEAERLLDRSPRRGGFVRASAAPRSGGTAVLRSGTTLAVVRPKPDEAEHGSQELWGPRIINGFDEALTSSGFHTSMLTYAQDDPQAEQKILKKVDEIAPTLGGVLCFLHSEHLPTLVNGLDKRNVPWVTVNRARERAVHNFVTHDALNGGRLIGRCFAAMGYQSAVVLADRLGAGRSTSDKFFGFVEGWCESDRRLRDMDLLQVGGWEESVGYAAIKKYVEGSGPPRAIFAAGDYLAIGAIRACQDLGLTVPEDVAVVGSTGLRLAAYTHPSLTVLDTPMEQIGREAARVLLEMAREGVRRMTGIYLPAGVTVRESCPIPRDVLEQQQAVLGRTL